MWGLGTRSRIASRCCLATKCALPPKCTHQMHPYVLMAPSVPMCTHDILPVKPGDVLARVHRRVLWVKAQGWGHAHVHPPKCFLWKSPHSRGKWGFTRVAKMMVMAVVHGFDGFFLALWVFTVILPAADARALVHLRVHAKQAPKEPAKRQWYCKAELDQRAHRQRHGHTGHNCFAQRTLKKQAEQVQDQRQQTEAKTPTSSAHMALPLVWIAWCTTKTDPCVTRSACSGGL